MTPGTAALTDQQHHMKDPNASNPLPGEPAARLSLFENSHSVMLLVDPDDGQIIDANPAAETFYGWPREQIRQMNIADINTLSNEQVQEEMQSARRAHRNHFRFRHRRADDSICDVEVFSGTVELQGRELLYSIVLDATARAQAEDALRHSEHRFRTLVDHAPDAVIIQANGRIRYVNHRAMELFAATKRDDLFGQSMLERVHPDWRDRQRERARRILNTRRALDPTEMEFLRLDGRQVPVEIACMPIVHDDEPAVLIVARDITERRRAEQRLRLAETVFTSTGEGIMITDNRPCILAVNPAFTEITGYSEAEVLGRNPKILQSGRQDRKFYQHMWRTLAEKGSWQGELWNRRKDGSIYPQISRINAIGDDGEVRYYVAVVTDLTELKSSEERIEHLYYHDLLTGLPNRTLFRARLERALAHAGPSERAVCMLQVDLDGFKHINESLGLNVGDEVLLKTVERLRRLLAPEQILARIGADEFAVLLHGEQRAASLAKEIVKSMSRPMQVEGRTLFVTASVGLANCTSTGCGVETMLRHCNTAVHQAKSEGGNTLRAYTGALSNYARDRVLLAARLRQAIDDDELVLHYQPQVNLQTGQVTGLEALVRWRHPEEGLTSPDRFIPIAEDTGLIIALGEQVLAMACRQARLWLDQGVPFGRLSVNVSGVQVLRSELVDTVAGVLSKFELPAEYLELELTETFVMDSRDAATDILDQLRSLGIRLAMDDFGTGYSSLSYLKELPFDTLKIDQAFTRNLTADVREAAICQAIVTLGQALGFRTLAEGVETTEQLTMLSSIGCDTAQGYLFGKPVAAADVANEIATINRNAID